MSLIEDLGESAFCKLTRKRVKSASAYVAYYSGFLRFYHLFSSPSESKVTILMYHRIMEKFSQNSSGTTPQDFEKQVAYLCNRFRIVSLNSFVEATQGGTKLPQRCTVITFDDGYKDNYTLAYPILRKYNAPATVFLATGHIGTNNLFWTDKLAYMLNNTAASKLEMPDLGSYNLSSKANRLRAISEIKMRLKGMPDEEKDYLVDSLVNYLGVRIPPELGADLFLSWDDVRIMHANGVSFGAHTVTHPRLTKVSKEGARAEIARSKKRIEEELNEPIRSFAYPGGAFDSDIKSIVREEGFACALTICRGINNLGSDLYELKRVGVEEQPFYEFAFDVSGIALKSEN